VPLPLEALHDWQFSSLEKDQFAIAVARHEAPFWPSPEIPGYAKQRSLLLHRLVDDHDINVVSWGQTDESPREVVQVILQVAQIVVPTVATVLAAWIARPRLSKPADNTVDASATGANVGASVPGFAIGRDDGARLEVTYKTMPGEEELHQLLSAFLSRESSAISE
jgi:hypothetical protein